MRIVQRSRHVDLLLTDWLQAQRTRSHSSEHVYSNGAVHTGVYELQFAHSNSRNLVRAM